MPKIEHRGRPVPKSYKQSKSGNLYRPKKVRDQERQIAQLWSAKYPNLYWEEAYVKLSVHAYIADRRHADLKNYIFLVEDALSGEKEEQKIAYKDDKQVKQYFGDPEIHFVESKFDQKTVIILEEY